MAVNSCTVLSIYSVAVRQAKYGVPEFTSFCLHGSFLLSFQSTHKQSHSMSSDILPASQRHVFKFRLTSYSNWQIWLASTGFCTGHKLAYAIIPDPLAGGLARDTKVLMFRRFSASVILSHFVQFLRTCLFVYVHTGRRQVLPSRLSAITCTKPSR